MCRFCEETDIHISGNLMTSLGKRVFADFRYDACEAEFDIEFGLLNSDGKVNEDLTDVDWCGTLKINYCPMCGKTLRDRYVRMIDNEQNGKVNLTKGNMYLVTRETLTRIIVDVGHGESYVKKSNLNKTFKIDFK